MSVGKNNSRPPSFYRAVAVDFDFTLTSGGAPGGEVIAALEEARAAGLAIILVTGRIVEDLEAVWPEAIGFFDCVVAENGAVLHTSAWRQLLAAPVDKRLDVLLSAAGVPFQRGEVLLSASTTDETTILEQVRALGLGCHTLANRGALMLLPEGVTKGTGLYHALGQLGLSLHNTIVVGDAENDHALFEMSELAVAVSNAIDSLKSEADIVLDSPDGEGVACLLRGDVVAGRRVVHSPRWQLDLGAAEDGRAVLLPASQLNVLIAGGTGDGKSYLAGLMAEQLLEKRYSLLVLDPEGDHVGLSHLSGALVVGGALRLPDPDEVLRLLHHRYASVVVDLSGLDDTGALDYENRLLTRVEAHRRATGLPHWVFLDEANRAAGRVSESLPVLDPAEKGYCLITWRPEELAVDSVASLDAVVALGSTEPGEEVVNLAASVGDLHRVELAGLLAAGSGHAVFIRRDAPRQAQLFKVGARVTPHIRHTHKYDLRPLNHARRFHFRRSSAELTGVRAGNLVELEDELSHCERAVLRHHCTRQDFSRWVAGVFHDSALAGELAIIEASVSDTSPAASIEEARLALIRVLQSRLVF